MRAPIAADTRAVINIIVGKRLPAEKFTPARQQLVSAKAPGAPIGYFLGVPPWSFAERSHGPRCTWQGTVA